MVPIVVEQISSSRDRGGLHLALVEPVGRDALESERIERSGSMTRWMFGLGFPRDVIAEGFAGQGVAQEEGGIQGPAISRGTGPGAVLARCSTRGRPRCLALDPESLPGQSGIFAWLGRAAARRRGGKEEGAGRGRG